MGFRLSICLGFLLGTFAVPHTPPKSWQGIVPLKSTKADVEKLWGKPKPPPANGMHVYELNDNRSIYFTDEGEIYILYARFTNCRSDVSPDTVLWISVKPKRKTSISDLKIDETKFITYDPAFPPGLGYKAYEDEKEGYTILTFNADVEQIYYQPTAEDRKLCPDYFQDGKVIPFRIHVG